MCNLEDPRDVCVELGTIYALHSGNGVYKYIGYTTQRPNDRLTEHRYESTKPKYTHKLNWIRSIGPENLEMDILVQLPMTTLFELWEYEIRLIAEYRSNGFELVNGTDGGDGVSMTQEVREKIGQAHRGRVHTEQSRRNMSASRQNPTYRKNASEWMSSRVVSPETRAKISDAGIGRITTEETKKKLSEIGKNRIQSDATKAKLSAQRKGQPNMGAHVRWHLTRDITKPDCAFCVAGTQKVGQNVN